jgi:hypothetical protein
VVAPTAITFLATAGVPTESAGPGGGEDDHACDVVCVCVNKNLRADLQIYSNPSYILPSRSGFPWERTGVVSVVSGGVEDEEVLVVVRVVVRVVHLVRVIIVARAPGVGVHAPAQVVGAGEHARCQVVGYGEVVARGGADVEEGHLHEGGAATRGSVSG